MACCWLTPYYLFLLLHACFALRLILMALLQLSYISLLHGLFPDFIVMTFSALVFIGFFFLLLAYGVGLILLLSFLFIIAFRVLIIFYYLNAIRCFKSCKWEI